MVLSPDTSLQELMMLYPSAIEVLDRYGLGCASCIGAEFENLRDACNAHDIDPAVLMSDLDKVVNAHE